jgi:TonB family protein
VLNGPPVLQKAAEEAVLQWVYIPAMMDGVPVENQTHITINFQPLPAGHAAKPQNQPDHPQEAQAAATEAVPVYQIPGPEPAGKFLIAQIDHAETEFMLDPAFPKGAHGIVELAVTVGADGHVREAYATRADDAALGNAAVEAIRHKVFKPTLVNGLPVEDHMHLVLKFERPSTDAGKLPGGAPTPAPPPGAISQAVLLHKVDPVFPKITRQEGARGTVELVATIGADGKVKDVKVVKAADPALSKAAVEAVRQWVYKPTILNGVAIESQTHISIGFCCAK